jgi:hypothetical protein
MHRPLARDISRWRTQRPVTLGLLLCGIMATGSVSASGVYVWYDKDGRPQYSDRPQAGAEQVTVTPAQTYEAPKPAAAGVSVPSPVRNTPAPTPACRIVSPIADEVFLNVPSITVTAMGPPRVTPKLLLNGASIASPDGQPSFIVTPIPRGTYTAVVVFEGGQNGAPLCRTEPVVFHVRQPSVIRPAAPKPRA